ncbi:Uncharacterised protein [Mycobacteroides abscessus subsp. abscessus]|nr:Uncharacterised protein [Mycobacteroides abscessus subsp. abscessus]
MSTSRMYALPPGAVGRTSSTGPHWSWIRSRPHVRACSSWRRTVCVPELCVVSTPTTRRRRGCSPGRAASIRAWHANCSTRSRYSPKR